MNQAPSKSPANQIHCLPTLEVRTSSIDGKGLFAGTWFPARRKLGELSGQIISLQEARRRAKRTQRIAIVEFPGGKAMDASQGGNEFRYTNHSCSPNAFIRILGRRVEFYALRTIKPGEEITVNYGETQHNGTMRCTCSHACQTYL